jgi:hypothetical protein
MAKVGGGAAYSKLRDLDNSVNQGLQFWGQQEAARQENEKLRQERELIRKEKADADFASAYGSLEEFKQKVTGYNTYDEIGADFTNKAREAYVEQYKIAQRARETGDKQKLIEAEMNMKKIKGSFSQVVDINTTLAKRNEEYVKMVQDGTMGEVDADDWEAQNESLIRDKNFVIEFDKSYNPLIVGLQKDGSKEMVSDEKGGLKPYILDYKSVINGDWRPYRRVELTGKGGLIDSILSNLGSYEQKKNEGLYTVTSQLWNPQIEEAARVHIKSSLDNETMTGVLYRINGTKKKKDFTPAERKLVEDDLLKAVEGGYKQKYQEEFNKDLGAYNLGKEKNAIDRQGNVLKGRELDIAWYNANTKRMEEINKRIENNPDVNIGGTFEGKVYDPSLGKDSKPITVRYKTYTLRDKDKKKTPFVVGSYTNDKGEIKSLTASNVAISEDKRFMRYIDSSGKKRFIDYMNGTPSEKQKFDEILSDMVGRDVNNIESHTFSNQTNVTNQEDLRNKYGY